MIKFKNNYLEMEQISNTKYKCVFLGNITNVSMSADYLEKYFNKDKHKKITAYELIPQGCTIIPKQLSPLCVGFLIGGVLQDSLTVVYGICEKEGGISGYACSVFFLPDDKTLKQFIDYSSLHGDFVVKEKD